MHNNQNSSNSRIARGFIFKNRLKKQIVVWYNGTIRPYKNTKSDKNIQSLMHNWWNNFWCCSSTVPQRLLFERKKARTTIEWVGCQCHHHSMRMHFQAQMSFYLLCYRRGWMDMKICYFPGRVRSSKIYSGWSGNPEILKQCDLRVECLVCWVWKCCALCCTKTKTRHCRRCKFRYSPESCKTPTRFWQTQSEHHSCIEAMYIISCQHISGRKSIWNNRSLEGFSILSSTKGSRWIWLYKCWGWPATTTAHTANSTALFVFWKVSKSICTVV